MLTGGLQNSQRLEEVLHVFIPQGAMEPTEPTLTTPLHRCHINFITLQIKIVKKTHHSVSSKTRMSNSISVFFSIFIQHYFSEKTCQNAIQ